MALRLLVFADADSSCYVKVQGKEGTHHFADFLEALEFARSITGAEGAEVTVYDPTGKVTFQSLLVSGTDRKIA